ncbi:MAG: extracellular solute-binding protein [Arenicellales bacterium]
MGRFFCLVICGMLLAVPSAQALVFVAQPQETVATGEKIFKPIADLLSRKTGEHWEYRHPDNQLNYADIIVDDKADLYLGDPHFVGYQVDANHQRVLAQVPDQEWVLIAPQSSTGKLFGSRVTSSFSCTEALTCALPPPDLGMILFSNLDVFADNPLRHPMLVSVRDVSNVVKGVLSQRCYCGITRKALLQNVPEEQRNQLAVRDLKTTLGAAFTSSSRLSSTLSARIQAALLSPEGQQATKAMRDRLYGGAQLVKPTDPAAYSSSAKLLINEYLIPMHRMPKPGSRKTQVVTVGSSQSQSTASSSSTSQSSAGSTSQVSGDLKVVSWGGAYSKSQWNAYHDPYMKVHPSVHITEDESSAEGLKLLRQQEKSGHVTWDVVDMTASNAIEACNEGLAMKIPADKWLAPAPDGTPASKDFGDMIVTPCLAPEIVFSTAFGYRSDLLPKKMTSIKDVFDLKDFPGMRSLEKKPINNLEWALIADGVPADQVYDQLETPEGVNRAFRKLSTIKSHVIWWVKGDVPVKLLSDGTVTMASAYNGRLFAAIVERKEPISMMWQWQVFDLDGWVVPKGAPHLQTAKSFLRFATDTQRLADQAKYISYGPARVSSAPLIGNNAKLGIPMAPYMPTDPKNSKHVLLFNYKWWAQHQDDLTEQFQEWLNK